MKITPDELSDVLSDALEEYGESVREGVADAVVKTGKRALKMVKDKSPKKSGRYRKSWRMTDSKQAASRSKTAVTIHNTSGYQLTHLLENGHQKADGGRVAGTPHIRPAELEAQKLFPELVQQAIKEAGER